MRYLTAALLSLLLLSCSKEESPAAPVEEEIQIQVIATGADTTAIKSASNIVLVRVK